MNIAKFIENGVNHLYDAENIAQLNKFFKRSCYCCAMKNMPIDCDRCGIAFHHRAILTTFNDNIVGGEE